MLLTVNKENLMLIVSSQHGKVKKIQHNLKTLLFKVLLEQIMMEDLL